MFANIRRIIKRYLTLEKTKGGVSFLSDGDERITRSLVCERVTGAQHCSSLCEQSEGDGDVAKRSALKGQPV